MRSLVTPDLNEMQLWNTLTKGPLKENESAGQNFLINFFIKAWCKNNYRWQPIS